MTPTEIDALISAKLMNVMDTAVARLREITASITSYGTTQFTTDLSAARRLQIENAFNALASVVNTYQAQFVPNATPFPVPTNPTPPAQTTK